MLQTIIFNWRKKIRNIQKIILQNQILAYFDELSAFEFTVYWGFLGVFSFLAKNLDF